MRPFGNGNGNDMFKNPETDATEAGMLHKRSGTFTFMSPRGDLTLLMGRLTHAWTIN
jgi:hypothetical protein